MYQVTNKISFALLCIFTTLTLMSPAIAEDIAFSPNTKTTQVRVNKLLISQSQWKQRINESRISIGGLKLGMKTADIRRILGKPIKSKTSWSDCFGGYETTLKFNKLELIMNGDSLSSIVTSNSSYATESGIHVNDSEIKLKKTYSKFRSERSNNYIVYANENYGGVSFKINHGVITEISWITADC